MLRSGTPCDVALATFSSRIGSLIGAAASLSAAAESSFAVIQLSREALPDPCGPIVDTKRRENQENVLYRVPISLSVLIAFALHHN